jgi:hypothetical protein
LLSRSPVAAWVERSDIRDSARVVCHSRISLRSIRATN